MASHTHNLSPFGDSAAAPGLVSIRSFQVIKPILEHAILCAPNYWARFRPAARQAQDAGLGTSHVGFRTVRRVARPESD